MWLLKDFREGRNKRHNLFTTNSGPPPMPPGRHYSMAVHAKGRPGWLCQAEGGNVLPRCQFGQVPGLLLLTAGQDDPLNKTHRGWFQLWGKKTMSTMLADYSFWRKYLLHARGNTLSQNWQPQVKKMRCGWGVWGVRLLRTHPKVHHRGGLGLEAQQNFGVRLRDFHHSSYFLAE